MIGAALFFQASISGLSNDYWRIVTERLQSRRGVPAETEV
jgi:hypothetical protein